MLKSTTTTTITIAKNSVYVPAFLIGLPLDSVGILGFLIVIDVFTGIIKSGTIHGWRSIKSQKAKNGILAKLVLMLVPIVLMVAGKGIGVDFILVAKGSFALLILAETYSILGNIHSIHSGKEMDEFDAVQFVLLQIRGALERIIKKDN